MYSSSVYQGDFIFSVEIFASNVGGLLELTIQLEALVYFFKESTISKQKVSVSSFLMLTQFSAQVGIHI